MIETLYGNRLVVTPKPNSNKETQRKLQKVFSTFIYLGKQNRQRPGVTNGNLNTTSPNSHNHDKSIEKIYQVKNH